MNDRELKYHLCFSLLQKLRRKETGSFVISPLSLGTALAMLTAGLRGETKAELLELLGTSDESKLHSVYSDTLKEEDLPLKMANKYLAAEHIEIHQRFDSILRVSYQLPGFSASHDKDIQVCRITSLPSYEASARNENIPAPDELQVRD